MGIFSRAQRYQQTFQLGSDPAPEGAFSAFCFGCGAVSVCTSMPALYLGLPGRSESGFRLPYGNEHDLDWRYGFVRDGRWSFSQ